MARCGWCHNSGTYQGKKCVCSTTTRRYFPKTPAKKHNDLLPSAHKHQFHFLDRAGHKEWFMCEPCGATKKVYVD
jgi:uncharacterized protein (DUF2237 family)